MITDRQWLHRALPSQKGHLRYYFAFGGRLLATDKARIHMIQMPEKLLTKAPEGFFCVSPDSPLYFTEEDYRAAHPQISQIPDFAGAIKATLAQDLKPLDAELWIDRGAEPRTEHFLTGHVVDTRYFLDTLHGSPSGWKHRGTFDPLTPVVIDHEKLSRTAILMPIKE